MILTHFVDANIILRFLLNDHPVLSEKAKQIFKDAENGKSRMYVDEVVLAEVVWVLTSFYKIDRLKVVESINLFLSSKWVVSKDKSTLIATLHTFEKTSLDYIDCWVLAKAERLHLPITSFDEALKKQERKTEVGVLNGTAVDHDAYFHATCGAIAKIDTHGHVSAKSREIGKIVHNRAMKPDFVGHGTFGRVESECPEEIIAGCTALILGLLHDRV
jgi:predicted nucleic-acid-binding protein